MKLYFLRFVVLATAFQFFSNTINAQGIFTGINNTVINLPCTQPCVDLNFQVPHLKSDEDYQIVTIPYTPYPFTTPTGNELTALYVDDLFSQAINLPFPLCFYGNVYNQVVVGSNGLLTFDVANANCINAYQISPTIPYSLGTICNLSSIYYPRASIMGAYSDLDPRAVASPVGRKIEWRFEGVAPNRRFIASWNRVGVFGNSSCGMVTPTTFQIIVNESTAVIEVFFERLVCPDASNNGRTILGVQDFSRTKAVAAPGKNATIWTANNEGYRFVPSGTASRFIRSELYILNGSTPIAIATATTPTLGKVDISFPNICQMNASQQYLVKTIYSSCIDPTQPVIIDDTITINRSPMPATINMTATTCTGVNNGTITINPTGVSPYTYSLDGAPLVSGTAPFVFSNVNPGLHTVIAYDVNNCQTNLLSINVLDGPPLTTTANKTDALCNGGATGTITVTQPAIGTAPFEYSLDGTTWQLSNVFNGLAANTYTVFYRESNGCQGSLLITINQPTALSGSSAFTPVVCNGQSNAVITITPAGGITPYQFSIDGGTNWQSSNVFNMPANLYNVIIRDANNCTTTQLITVTEPAALTGIATNNPASCDGGNDGVINVTASGGNAGYEYSIDGGVGWQSGSSFNVGPGNYTVTVRDNKGCTTSFPTIVGLANNFSMITQSDPTICEGASTQLTLTSNATQYVWTPIIGLSNTTISNPIANPTVTTTYIVTATLGRCSANDTVLVNVNPAPIPNAGTDAFICYGQTSQLNASGGIQYKWTPDTYLSSSSIANPIATPTKDITYTLSILADVNGCASLTTDDIYIDVTPPIKVTTFPFDTVGYSGDKFQLLAIPNDSDVINYSWTPATGLSDPLIANPIVTLGLNGNVTQYKVTTSTIGGCIGEGYVTVKVFKGPDIYMPTAFTPNDDGRNDRFIPVPVGIKSLNYFRVFNRWGQLLFSTTQLHDGWDGKINNVKQPTGVYVWMIEAVTNQNRIIAKKGTVTVIR